MMKASLEIDLLLHFGFFKNVNLLSRGIYRLKVSLVCGSQKIVPVGMFAAPSSFHSSVDQQQIDSAGMITPAEVNEEQHCFIGRSIAIRYKGEEHELNEGVHWRFTLHDINLENQEQGPKINQLLGVKFELQFCDFLNESETLQGRDDDFRRFIPDNPNLETVAVQRLMIQSLTSGLHQLYSVSFDGDHFSSLDAMFHACISSIYYTHLVPISNSVDQHMSSSGNVGPANLLTPSKSSRRMSTTIEKVRGDSPFSSRSSIFKLLSSPEKILFGINGTEKTSDLSKAVPDNSNMMLPQQKISEDYAVQLFKLFITPIVSNYQRTVQNSQFIINAFFAWNQPLHNGSNSSKHVYDIESYNQYQESIGNQEKCIVLSNDESLLECLRSCTVFQSLAGEVIRNVDICNKIIAMRWTLIVNSLKHIMKPVKKYLMRGFLEETSAFWKQQQIIHTRKIGGAHHLNSNKDEDVLEILMQHIKFERDNDIVACTVQDQLRDDDGLYSSIAKSILPVFARGMTIFDTETHMIPSRLPYLFVEQYIPDQVDSRIFPDEEGQTSSLAQTKISPFRGVHVIFLQHGFMGSSYDMRQLAQALTLLCPANTLIFSLRANEFCGQESIQDMADKLAGEIFDYCADRAPTVLDEQIHHNQCRVSFVGHSLGSVMIRAALMNENLKCLRNKLHLFLSLASPHIGNLFSESQLVSTGMWALLKFKNCKSLKELIMVDNADEEPLSATQSQSRDRENDKEKSFLYRISKFKTFSFFKKVVLVSCPKDQYVPFYSARIQTTPKIVADGAYNGLNSNGGIVSSMIHNLMDNLEPHQLLRITVMNYNSSIHVPPRCDDKGAKSGKEKKHDYNSTNEVASLLLKENDSTIFDVNNMIGRSAHICYLESPVVAYQLILSLQKYFTNDQMPV